MKIYELRKPESVIETSVSLQHHTPRQDGTAAELMNRESVPPRPKSAKELGATNPDHNPSEHDSQTSIPARARTMPAELPAGIQSSQASSDPIELFVPFETAEKSSSAHVAPDL